MAIFKISGYISKYSPTAAKLKQAKAHLHYIIHRKGREGEKMERQLFDRFGDDVGKEYVNSLIENSKSQNIFKIILNFSPTKEDTYKDLNLRIITQQVMLKIKERIGVDFEYVGVMHNDHGNPRPDGTPKRHIHSMAFIDGSIERPDIKVLIEFTTQQALSQRRAHDLSRHYRLDRSYSQQLVGMAGGRARRVKKARLPALACSTGGITHRTTRMKSGESWCLSCEKVIEQNQGLSL
jgi:hypothetical protein